MMQNRTHTCGEPPPSDAGKQVKISGWMENVRVVSANLAFVVVRDFYGTTQVVAEAEDMVNTFKAITKESTISVEGVVRERDSKTDKMATGDIEIVPAKVEVLGRCQHSELPFQINRSREADEAQRLKYRYLDLRNPAVKKNIILRCNVVAALRKSMTEHGFLEITTPILTASSPEGARDYLVPARNHPGKFYALPQAPQQFKQLLMTSGFDRYFQIAPCFRDEDARADRSPGEFYQLDMEMAFATQEDVFAVLEDVLPPIFAQYGAYNRASGAPFTRIPYTGAMENYGSDKPDLRIDLRVQDVTAVLGGCGFEPFAEGNLVKAVKDSDLNETRKFIDKTLADVETVSGGKTYWFRMDENGELVGGPMYYIKNGLGSRWQFLAVLYSLFGVLTVFGTGNATQVNTIVTAIDSALLAYGSSLNSILPTVNLVVGVVVAMMVAMVLLGGVKRIGSVTEKLVPFMALFYVVLALGVVVINYRRFPAVLASIVGGAFDPQAFTGGVIGSIFLSMQKGVSRGIFSNEAGLGTGSIAHACADTSKPVKQGMFGIFEVFADTIVICTLTAMVILCSGTPVNYGTAAGAELTISGFTTTYGGWASIFTAVALCCFAFSTIIGWGLYGSRFLVFLCHSDKVAKPFFLVYSFVSILGATMDLGLLWSIADTFNGLMSIPNLIALLLLSGTVVKLTREFFASEG